MDIFCTSETAGCVCSGSPSHSRGVMTGSHTRESDFSANDAFRDCVVGQERGQLDLCQKQERERE